MLIARIKFAPWDKAYDFSVSDIDLSVGDWVVVETEIGQETGIIISIHEVADNPDLKPILRKAEYDDILNNCSPEKKAEALNICTEIASQQNLDMKLVDVYISSHANRYNFAFLADGRIDFRVLVKELAARLGASIRLTQIGSRDEAKITGDCGPCGRGLCCRGFMTDFISIGSEMAEAQQVVHRGSDRISGMCGRLMCCLSYEYEGYKDLAGELPAVGARVNVDGSRGVIVSQHILKQTVDVRLDSDREGERSVVIEVDINRRKKEKEKQAKEKQMREKNKKQSR